MGSKLKAYAAALMDWWQAAQPNWRGGGWPPRSDDDDNHDWAEMRRGGQNGLFLAVMGLSFWMKALKDKEDEDFTAMLNDVTHVLSRVTPPFDDAPSVPSSVKAPPKARARKFSSTDETGKRAGKLVVRDLDDEPEAEEDKDGDGVKDRNGKADRGGEKDRDDEENGEDGRDDEDGGDGDGDSQKDGEEGVDGEEDVDGEEGGSGEDQGEEAKLPRRTSPRKKVAVTNTVGQTRTSARRQPAADAVDKTASSRAKKRSNVSSSLPQAAALSVSETLDGPHVQGRTTRASAAMSSGQKRGAVHQDEVALPLAKKAKSSASQSSGRGRKRTAEHESDDEVTQPPPKKVKSSAAAANVKRRKGAAAPRKSRKKN